jgi:hypothetical protein
MAQAEESLVSKCEALSSNPSNAKRKKKERSARKPPPLQRIAIERLFFLIFGWSWGLTQASCMPNTHLSQIYTFSLPLYTFSVYL